MKAGADFGEPNEILRLVRAKKFFSIRAPGALVVPGIFAPVEILVEVNTEGLSLRAEDDEEILSLPRRCPRFAAETAVAAVAVRGGRRERAIMEEKRPEPRRLGESMGGGV